MNITNSGTKHHNSIVTGERIVTRDGGFNPSWQRHAACYGFAAGLIGPGVVLDVGCGLGHARSYLGSRRTIGIDLDHSSLCGQDREAVRADMRRLPFGPGAFDAVVSIHAIEHVPDAKVAVSETSRVLATGGVAIFATPNRLTFGLPDEIIDPYHFVEYDPQQLETLCSEAFSEVEIHGIFGSGRYMEFFGLERKRLDTLLSLDPLKLRRFIPLRAKQLLYDWKLSHSRRNPDASAEQISVEDFDLRSENLEQALDLIAVCSGRKSGVPPA
ncbi:MAG: class I SAM-dependent methyltransferase [Actinomycetota bacterium]